MRGIQTFILIHLKGKFPFCLLLGSALLATTTLSAQYSLAATSDECTILPSIEAYSMHTMALSFDTTTANLALLQTPKSSGRYRHTAIFCVMEDQVTQSSKVNLRLRLGSTEYVDRMEGKPHVGFVPEK